MAEEFPAKKNGVWVEAKDVSAVILAKCQLVPGCYYKTEAGMELVKVSLFWVRQRGIREIDNAAVFS